MSQRLAVACRLELPRQESWIPLKQIVAVIKPFLAEKLLESLKRAPIEAMQVREAKGFGRQKSYLDQYTDTEFSTAFLPKVEITIWVAINAPKSRMGDGKIMMLPVEQAFVRGP